MLRFSPFKPLDIAWNIEGVKDWNDGMLNKRSDIQNMNGSIPTGTLKMNPLNRVQNERLLRYSAQSVGVKKRSTHQIYEIEEEQ